MDFEEGFEWREYLVHDLGWVAGSSIVYDVKRGGFTGFNLCCCSATLLISHMFLHELRCGINGPIPFQEVWVAWLEASAPHRLVWELHLGEDLNARTSSVGT